MLRIRWFSCHSYLWKENMIGRGQIGAGQRLDFFKQRASHLTRHLLTRTFLSRLKGFSRKFHSHVVQLFWRYRQERASWIWILLQALLIISSPRLTQPDFPTLFLIFPSLFRSFHRPLLFPFPRHLIADHLGWFKDSNEPRTVEEIVKAHGGRVRRGVALSDGLGGETLEIEDGQGEEIEIDGKKTREEI